MYVSPFSLKFVPSTVTNPVAAGGRGVDVGVDVGGVGVGVVGADGGTELGGSVVAPGRHWK